jgi:hypothetical protein
MLLNITGRASRPPGHCPTARGRSRCAWPRRPRAASASGGGRPGGSTRSSARSQGHQRLVEAGSKVTRLAGYVSGRS